MEYIDRVSAGRYNVQNRGYRFRGCRMKCPDCNTEMEWGKVYLKGTLGGAILYGRAYKHCYFDSFTGDLKKIKIIDNGEKKRAYYCKACGMVIMK